MKTYSPEEIATIKKAWSEAEENKWLAIDNYTAEIKRNKRRKVKLDWRDIPGRIESSIAGDLCVIASAEARIMYLILQGYAGYRLKNEAEAERQIDGFIHVIELAKERIANPSCYDN